MDLTTVVGGLFRPWLDFVFPPTCIACQRPLTNSERHVCRECWSSILRLHSRHHLFCQTCDRLVESGVIQELVSVFLFEKDGVFQSLAHALKYDGFRSVGRLAGRELGDLLVNSRITAECLVPIPLHRTKLRERGFNQAEEIARGASAVTGIPVRTDILRRVRYTQTQTKLDQEQRRKNVEDAFLGTSVQAEACILVDDVITTGATIIAAGDALRNAGFKRIVAASLALAE